MRLVEDGKLALDDPAFAYLPDLTSSQTEDSRLASITIRDLLRHSGGWDRDATGYDPMFDVTNIGAQMGRSGPAELEDIVRYMRGRRLDFTPGIKYAYSNFGYAVLGLILEHVTGESYEALAKDVLADAGITGMDLGRTRLEDRQPREVRYYFPAIPTTRSVIDGSTVPYPYGGFYLDVMDAHGGWIASAADLLRFATAIDGNAVRPDLLTASSEATMSAQPNMSYWNGSAWWYALGWTVNTNGNWWHTGSLPGSESLLVRANYKGLQWAVLLNIRTNQTATYMAELDNAMWTLAQGVTTWPTHDLFGMGTAAEPAVADGLGLDVAPNPVRDRARVSLDLPMATTARVEVFDVLGRRVATLHDGALSAGPHDFVLDAASLPAGLAVVRAVTDAGVVSRRVTVIR